MGSNPILSAKLETFIVLNQVFAFSVQPSP
jgi:hypothetical protein